MGQNKESNGDAQSITLHLTRHNSASYWAISFSFLEVTESVAEAPTGTSDADVNVAFIKQYPYWSVWTSGAERTG